MRPYGAGNGDGKRTQGCGLIADCNADEIPDDCQLEDNDCNTNAIPDDCDIAAGTSLDCNANDIPDECDLTGGKSSDCNTNGIPDECDVLIARLFVDATATGAGTGTNWTDAFVNLQDALSLGDCTAGMVTEIWVAAGTYHPDQGGEQTPGDRKATFQLISGLAIYGGLAGDEDPDTFDLADRDLLANETILSGDLDGDDGPDFANNDENSYHVLTGSETDSSALLDGFTITAGNADGAFPDDGGGGMYNDIGHPALIRCAFIGNTALGGGGGMSNEVGSSPTLTDCTFTGNSAFLGAGMYNLLSGPTVTNCTFTDNPGDFGGGMFNDDNSSPALTNCTFTGNSAQIGAGMYNHGSSNPTLTNCTFTGNSADLGGGILNQSSNPTVTNCTFSGNSASADGGGMFNVLTSSPTVTNCTFSGNTAPNGNGGGMYNESASNPTLTNCIFWGNSDSGGMDESAQIHEAGTAAVVTYSNVQGGWTGAGGTGNINTDLLYVDADGDDNIPGTEDDNLRLDNCSPAVDAGDNNAVPGGITTDLDGNPRFVDDTGIPDHGDPGSPGPPIVDMGAYERQEATIPGPIENVTQGTSHCRIQWAIDAAMGGDEIVVPPDTYHETIDFLGKAITLRSSGGAAVTTIDGTNLNDSVVKCISGEGPDTVLDGFTITGGTGGVDSFCTGAGNFSGGGMLNDASSPTVTNCTFTANTSLAGGGMANCDGSSPTVTNCAFIGNSDFFVGGGGMLNAFSSPMVSNCTFSENTTCNGGGIFNVGSSPIITNCTFTANTAFCVGGAGVFDDSSASTITNCTFIGNEADGGSGGAIWIGNNAGTAVTNCTFSGNSAGQWGGGVFIELTFAEAAATVTNCTFSGNSAVSNGGGMYIKLSVGSSTVANCMFWNNSDAGGLDESAQLHVAAGTPVVTYSDIQNLVPGGVFDSGANLNNINADPLFVDPDGDDDIPGTEDDNLRLLSGSPCIDLGYGPALPPDDSDLDGDDDLTEPIPLDLDANPRVRGCRVDMGAFEFDTPDPPLPDLADGVILVAEGALNTDGLNWQTAYALLQDALAAAASDGAITEIWVAAGAYYPDRGDDQTLGDRAASFQLLNGVALYGGFVCGDVELADRDPAVNVTILSGDLNTDDGPDFANNGENSYHVVIGDGTDGTAVLDGFTIAAGNADGDVPDERGAGMLNDNGSPTLANCTFTGNSAIFGGAMFDINSSNPMLDNCTFSGNEAGSGGGLYNASNSSPTMTNCTFSGNMAAGLGGGMYNNSSSPTLTNCTFSGNTAENAGGGMYNVADSSPTLTDCTFSGNVAENGAGMYSNSSPTLTDCTFTANMAINNGGGMHNLTNGSPTVTNCTFSGNGADFGGGMYNTNGSTPTLTGCAFTTNMATTHGGGMYNDISSPTLTDCTFSGNAKTLDGGGMFNESSSPTVTNCTFSQNTAASDGGGMYNLSSDPTVTNCTFSQNTATSDGGGMYNLSSDPTVTDCTFSGNSAFNGGGMNNRNGSPTLINCTFRGNTAGQAGGGVFNNAASPSLINSTFSGNTSTLDGGGMYNSGGSPTLTNCTFSQNTAASDGGGMENVGGAATLTNCILWANSDNGGMDESAQIHVFSGAPVVTFSDVQGGWTGDGGIGNIDADPLYVDADGDDLRLQLSSPCIDVGNNDADIDANEPDVQPLPDTDLVGNGRILDGDNDEEQPGVSATVDMGAYEFPEWDGNDDLPGGATDTLDPGDDGCDPAVDCTPTQDGLIEITNLSGDSGSIMVFETDEDLHPDAEWFGALGTILIIETDLPDGQFLMTVSIPFDADDLNGTDPTTVDLTWYDEDTGEWIAAVCGNTLPNPACDANGNPLSGTRHVDTDPPDAAPTLDTLHSLPLGDYGVFWNSTDEVGFAWANVDHSSDFSSGLKAGCSASEDCDDGDDCTVDTCDQGNPEADGDGCVHEYQVQVYADICSPFDPPNGPQPDLDDILCELDDFADGASVSGCPGGCTGAGGPQQGTTDLHPCPEDGGGDGLIILDDILNMLDAFAGQEPCDDPCPE